MTGWLILGLILAACDTELPDFSTREPAKVSVIVDGATYNLTSDTGNVRELLEEAGIEIDAADLVEPPLFTPLTDGLEVTVVRVSESIEVIEQIIPYQRRLVRNESMSAEDPPLVIQAGQTGLQEVTVRIVYRNGLEYSRQETKTLVVEPARDEIIMVGLGASAASVDFPGLLAYYDGGNSLIMRGSTLFPQQMQTGSDLDRRVFSLSPSGSHLLFTRSVSETGRFNSLWVIGTERGADARPLGIDNVLWAAWNPSKPIELQIAYTTGVATQLFPGWEANNDLWLADISPDENVDTIYNQLVEAYPATYSWWGGNYTWSPTGKYIAFGYADEVGLLNLETLRNGRPERRRLRSFTEYNTRADWVWIPSISWSPDGKYIAFTEHGGLDPQELRFDTRVMGIETEISTIFVENSGIWSHPHWSSVALPDPPGTEYNGAYLAILKATNPLDSLRSSYTLWLMDRDGSNAGQLFPPVGENSRFNRDSAFLAWSPDGREVAFVYDSALHIANLHDRSARKITQDDTEISNPSWAPYGAATISNEFSPQVSITPTPGLFRPGGPIGE